jgi:signal transduction histidine kinase/HPt (histidine-containing phosphotransfer) domain-containing protein/ActR/RegA family two-component response regulator
MNMDRVLQKFPMEVGFALLEHCRSGDFLPIAELPNWFSEIWAEAATGSGSIPLSRKSAFLENFLLDAEEFWNSPGSASCQSETWIEKSVSGREIPVQAKALFLDGKRILALFSPESQFREQVKILQTARNALLDHERLAREIQKKEILLHCIVHDLSQPLSVMHVAMDSLLEESISERSKQFLTLGMHASDQQETMIRQILQTFSDDLRASLDAGTEENSSSDLLECARKTMTSLGPTFEAKGVHLAVSSLVDLEAKWPVIAEESRLQRIFSNLLENALRYTPAGSRVTIGVEDEGDFLKAYVDDEGCGLPQDLRPEQIFGLFMKGKQGGGKAGLGLYFCRITVERWGGSIGCVTLPEKGSRFWFRLPRGSGHTAARTSDPRDISSSTGTKHKALPVRPLRILLADDQEDIRTLTAYQLRRSGHKVVIAKDGMHALRAFRSASFDVVLLDQEMPGMTGDEVALAIRKAEQGKKKGVFLVASTGNATLEDTRRLKQSGFDEILGKPFRLENLNLVLSSSPAAKPATHAPPMLSLQPGATFAELVTRVGGDEKLLKRMIQTFLRDTPKRLAGISTAIRRKNPEALASLAHALKGSVSIFGAEAARNRSQELQELGRSGELSMASEVLSLLKEEIAKLQANLRGYANQTPARPKSNHPKRQRPPRNRGKRRR